MGERVTVIGAGSWGTALAKLLAEKGLDVALWAHEPEVAEGINRKRRNPLYLAEVTLPEGIAATDRLEGAVAGASVVVSAVPSHALRRIWQALASELPDDALVVSCTKGIEAEGLKLMSQVLADCLPSHPAKNRVVLSGPSFAAEVARGLPTSVVVAGTDAGVTARVQEIFRTHAFLTFTGDDVIGVEVGGAVKNVIAIAAGVSDGLALGHNTRAAIITRGLYEMIKIGQALGANPITFAGLSGIGDLVLTCTANLSRNHTLGFDLGRGRALSDLRRGMRMAVEGLPTAEAVHRLAAKHGLNIPICDAMYRILYEGLEPRMAVEELCSMPLALELGALLH
ncbi:MAG: NAD(P)-dependent glycerol-3-phosphate dehydrogenase [Proteobacteria bacterium]|nr:NAD(P)-dependent glycerol-3-phosphate dehydrogenase [Pseudomonadota bacterium]